jgi:hypothetical protein
MRRSIPFSLEDPEAKPEKKKMVLALSRVGAELEQVSDRHTRLLLRVKNQEKIVTNMLEQLSQRQAATLRHLTEKEAEVDKKLARLAKKQKEILKKIG